MINFYEFWKKYFSKLIIETIRELLFIIIYIFEIKLLSVRSILIKNLNK